MKVRQFQTSMNRGEVSTGITVRTDLDTYQKGVDKLRNGYISNQGGAYRREGLRWLDGMQDNLAGKQIDFEFNTEQTYLLVFTPGQFRVYRNDSLVATITSGLSALTATIIAEMTWVQTADTLFLFHIDLPTMRITRTSHTVWSVASVAYTNIPTFNFGSGAEPVISATRGWPRCGAFFSGRFWLGGLKSRPQTMLASQNGDYFNLGKGTGLDNEAIDVTIDDDKVNAILNFYSGRVLFILTTGSEYKVQDTSDPVKPSNISQLLNKTTDHGSSPVRPVDVDGAVVFVERTGLVLRQMVYDFQEDSFNAENVSRFSPHLVRNPVNMAVRSSVAGFPANYAYLVNNDGTLAVLNIMRSETLLGWSLIETDGFIEDVAVLNDQQVYLIVRRTINNATVRYLEKLDTGYRMDCSIKKSRAGITNGMFENGLTGWTNLSTAGGSVAVENGVCVLRNNNQPPGAIAWVEQAVVLDAVPYTLTFDVKTIPGKVPLGFAVRVGTASGLGDVATVGFSSDGNGNIIKFTPGVAGTYYIGFRQQFGAFDLAMGVDNVRLLANRWTGLGVLEGRTVKVQVDGFVADDAVVTGGTINASIPGTTLEVGLMMALTITTLPPVVNLDTGSSAGQRCRLVEADIYVENSQPFICKVGERRFAPLFYRFGGNVLDKPPPLVTDWVNVSLAGVAKRQQLTITQDDPVPLNVLGMNIAIGV